jgi:signal transduction histidine kinase
MHRPEGTVQAIVYVAQDLTPRKQAEEALAERTRQLEAVRAVTTEITRELELTALLALISRHAQDLVQATSVSISLWDEEAQVLVPQTWLGFEGSWRGEVRLRLGEAVAGTVAERREGMIVNDFRTSRYALPIFLERSTYTAVLAEPLLYRSQLVGVIAVAREQDRPPFAEKDRELLRLFATQAAIAIENARLHEATLRRAGELQALLRATRTVMSGLDLKGTLDRIIHEAAHISGIPHVKVVLVDKAAKVLRLGAVTGRPVEMMAGFEYPLDSGLSGVVATTGQPLFAPDCQHDPRNFAAAQDRELGIVTYLGLPITSRDEVMGVLTFNTEAPHEYTPEEIAYLTSFADQAAIAIENARLYEAAQREVAERAKAEEALARQARELARFNAELQAKNADLDSFVYIVSHDLKAPLVTLQGMSSILLEEYGDKLDDEGRHFLERIQENTRQMESLIMDLLALSRIGREARSPEVVNLSEVVNEFLLEMAERIQERGITVLRGDLGSVWALRVQMEQVIGNLLSNAIKYIGDVPSPMVEIGSLDRGGYLEVHVKDNGIGIDPAYHERIFEIFQRLGEIEAEGTGIGLTIVRKIVDAAGGRVWVESAKGKGATFRFTWPKLAPAAGPTRPDPTSSQPAQEGVPLIPPERHARAGN